MLRPLTNKRPKMGAVTVALLLEALQHPEGHTVDELVDYVGLSKATVYMYIRELNNKKLIYVVNFDGQKEMWAWGPGKVSRRYPRMSVAERSRKCRQRKQEALVHLDMLYAGRGGTVPQGESDEPVGPHGPSDEP